VVSRTSIAPSESKLTLKRSAVVVIGVDRRNIGGDDGSCRRLWCVTPGRAYANFA
jgi:hypothetical protein